MRLEAIIRTIIRMRGTLRIGRLTLDVHHGLSNDSELVKIPSIIVSPPFDGPNFTSHKNGDVRKYRLLLVQLSNRPKTAPSSSGRPSAGYLSVTKR